MELSHVLTALIGWTVLSVPVSLLIGAFMGHGAERTQDAAVRVHTSTRG